MAVFGVYIVAGVVSGLALMAHGDHSLNPLVSRYGWMLFSAAVPVAIMLYAMVLWNPDLAPGATSLFRATAISAAALSAAAGIAVLIWQVKLSSEQTHDNENGAACFSGAGAGCCYTKRAAHSLAMGRGG